MRTSLVPAIALLVGCTAETPDTDTDTDEPIVAGTETVSTSWDVDMFTLYESPTIPRFDTLDGRRQLDGMTIAVDHTAVMTVDIENDSEFALSGEDYTFEFYYQTITQLGLEQEPPVEGEGPPFFGPGAFLAVVEVDLAAADGTPEAGDDFHRETVTEDVHFEAPYDWEETPTYLEAMIGDDELQLVVGGFSEAWVYWHDDHGGEALLLAGASALRYSGTMTVTYEYSPTEE